MATRRVGHGGHAPEAESVLPEGFDSRGEEAEYWENTDLTELAEGELEEVKVDRPKRPTKATFAVRLDQGAVELIRTVARIHDVGPTTLVRKWVMERLEIEREAGVMADPVLRDSIDENELRTKTIATIMAEVPTLVANVMDEVARHADYVAFDESKERLAAAE